MIAPKSARGETVTGDEGLQVAPAGQIRQSSRRIASRSNCIHLMVDLQSESAREGGIGHAAQARYTTPGMRFQPVGFSLLVLATLLVAAAPTQAQDEDLILIDPAKIRTAEACGECHVEELEVWKRTPHATGFKTLHRKESAEAIAEKMGFKLIKRESLCLRCHYTPEIVDGQLRAVSGVSCESCHGAARDWIDIHNNYGGKGITYATETPEHRKERIEKSRAAGMRRPSDLYGIVKNCFGCHTVPHERLVNEGGHSVGSVFELVAWSEKIRHNFLDAMRGGSRKNVEWSPERKRVLYVVGRAVDLESALRAVAGATGENLYLKAMMRRVRVALSEVRAIARRAELPEVDAMIAAARGVHVGLGQREALLKAANTIGEATRRFISRQDGTLLAALDPLILGIDDGLDVEDEETAVAEAPAGAAPSAGPEAAPTDSGTSPAASSTRTAPADRGVPAVGERKSKIRPVSAHATIGPGGCSRCHAPQNAWWFSDVHYRSADPFFDEAEKNKKIARLYGLSPSRITRGDELCMDCHGTVVTGKERRDVQDGVSCESCHGAAADWLAPHQEGDPALKLERPGYKKALQLGKNDLRDPEVRARACAGCHYITDPRLISSGHPSGTDFKYLEAMEKTRHWEHRTEPGVLQAAYDGVLQSRGAVPEVRLARLPSSAAAPAPKKGPSPTERAAALAPRPRTSSPSAASSPSSSSSPSSPTPPPTEPRSDLALPPFPDIPEGMPVEDVLLLLKQRLELLYRALYPQQESP